MEIVTWYSSLTQGKKYLLLGLVLAMVCSALTFHFTAKHYQAKYDALNEQFISYKTTHPDADENQREKAIIDKAILDKKNNVPVTETVGSETKTIIQYVEKTSKSDADIEVTNKAKPITVSYNGKTSELATTNTEKQTTDADGKVVITQQTAATIDIDSIVKREIANKILEDDHDKAVLERQKKQNAFWGTVAGFAIGSIAHK